MATQSPAPLPYNLLGIPTEIVQHIFAFFATTLSTEKPQRFPWFLGHICSTWRSIFLSMGAEFWHSISIIFGGRAGEYAEDVLRFFLERDPAAPFSFELFVYYFFEPNSQGADQVRQTLYMLTDVSLRWSGAWFRMHTQYLSQLKHTMNRLPLLQELMLVIVDELPIPDSLSDMFQNAPSLNVVKAYNLANWQFNLSNLKVIDVDKLGHGASDFIAALPRMAKLERLRIGFDVDYIHAMPTSIILLPNLTTLDCKSDWLCFLEAPALKNFTIRYRGPKSFEDMLSFLHRSRCNANISSVCIKSTRPASAQFIRLTSARAATAVEIIRRVPNITHLVLENVNDKGNVFRQLTVSTNPTRDRRLARHMLSLSIYDISINDMQPLYDLISSRTVDSASDKCGYKRLRKLVTSGRLTPDVVALCEERGVQCTDIREGDR